ncbi:MAG: zinc-binding alcohol dehydrogenase family protein [Verrucomicrobia bacterium]|nr:zinc-binding alcohol dehydrogenase family protein [Verrucomicrobiota bacterium]
MTYKTDMSADTKAVVFTELEKAVIQTIEMLPPGPSEVQVRTTMSTISTGTEGWIYRNLFTWASTPFPCVPGYQRAGRIVAIGPDVQGWHVGERVMAVGGVWEGTIRSFWGAHLASANTLVAHLFRIPDGVDDVDASGAVVAQVGYNAAQRVTMNDGGWALVYGDGIIGQCAVQAARARGFKVILVGHHPERLDLGARHGADFVINNHHETVVAAVHRCTGSKTVAAVLDSVQGETVQREYLPLLERGRGQIVYCGFSPERTWADMALLQQNEITTHFVAGWTRLRMEATLALMAADKIRVRPLITHQVPFHRAPEMYDLMLRKSGPFLGITLDWTGADA